MQAANCYQQSPAQTVEYFRLGKPILALTTETRDTASVLMDVGGATIINLNDEGAIYRNLALFIEAVAAGRHPRPFPGAVRRFARRNLTKEFAIRLKLLEEGQH